MKPKYCCPTMEEKCEFQCSQHFPRFCVHNMVGVLGDGRTVIFIHDGNDSGMVIDFCPWCGKCIKSGVNDGKKDHGVVEKKWYQRW